MVCRRGAGRSKHPFASTLITLVPPHPPFSCLLPLPLFYCKILCNVVSFFPFFPASHLGDTIRPPLFFHFLNTSCPLFSRVFTPCVPPPPMGEDLYLRQSPKYVTFLKYMSACLLLKKIRCQ